MNEGLGDNSARMLYKWVHSPSCHSPAKQGSWIWIPILFEVHSLHQGRAGCDADTGQ